MTTIIDCPACRAPGAATTRVDAATARETGEWSHDGCPAEATVEVPSPTPGPDTPPTDDPDTPPTDAHENGICIGTTAEGERCSKKARPSGWCHLHEPKP